jgi:uncharacterized membrane protein YgcG
MSGHHRRVPWTTILLPIILMLAAGIGSAAFTTASAAPRDDCAGPVAGKHIYDCAHLLTPAEIANLETQAAAVDQAGAPTIVYLQVRDASAQQTLQDAIDLMGRWNVESHTGAHDGFVMFFNLQSGNHRHGQVGLYAGEKHSKTTLPIDELTRIRTDVMTPLLANEQTADGIAAGLQMVAHDLRYGPPPPPPPPAYRAASATIARVPFNIVGALFAGIVALLFLRVKRQPPISSARDEVGMGSLATPGELPPGIAGALIKGRVADAQIEATILDFARRGLLAMEPTSNDKVRVRLLGDGKDLTGYERDIWRSLTKAADDEDHTISSGDLADVRKDWSWSKDLLRRDLIERGWYDPKAAAARRRPFYAMGAIGMVGVIIAAILIALSLEGWAAIGLVIFLAAGVGAFIGGYAVHDTTVEGEIAAAPWRGYLASVSDRAYEPNLDTDLPYIVGLGLLGKLAPRLKAASERGYSPSWFHVREGQAAGYHAGMGMGMGMGFYPYWIGFHSSMAPTSSGGYGGGSAAGGYSGGGAAGGGGGSAGGF